MKTFCLAFTGLLVAGVVSSALVCAQEQGNQQVDRYIAMLRTDLTAQKASIIVSNMHLPLDENFRFGAGLQYDWSEAMTIGVAYEFLYAGSAEIAGVERPAGTLQGDYSPNHIQFIALNVVMKF